MRRQRSRNINSAPPPLLDKSAFDVSEREFEHLLGDLCVELGYCISGPAARRLWDSRPSTVDEFVEGLFVAEGVAANGGRRTMVKAYVQNFIAARRAP